MPDTATAPEADAPPDADPSRTVGSLRFETHALRAPKDRYRAYTVQVGFARYQQPDRCTRTVVEGCIVETCSGPAETPTRVSAGTVTFSRALASAPFPLSIAPNSDKTYSDATGGVTAFVGGDAITATASGAELPSFTVTATAPSAIVVDEPLLNGIEVVPVVRTKPLRVAWHVDDGNAVAGDAEAIFYSLAESRRVICRAPIATGSLQAPPAALAHLPPGEGGLYVLGVTRVSALPGTDIMFDLETTASARTTGPADGPIAVE